MAVDVAALGKRIAQLRALRALSLSALAEAAGLAKSYLAKLEEGDVENPGLKTIGLIARALDVTIADLLAPAERAPGKTRNAVLAESDSYEAVLANLPEGLAEFLASMAADRQPVPPDLVRALAAVRFRGKRPRKVEDWRFLYDAMRRSVS